MKNKLKNVKCGFKSNCLQMDTIYLEQYCGCYNEIAQERSKKMKYRLVVKVRIDGGVISVVQKTEGILLVIDDHDVQDKEVERSIYQPNEKISGGKDVSDLRPGKPELWGHV